MRSGMCRRCEIELGLNVLCCALAKSSVLLKEAEGNGVQAEGENGVGGTEERRRKCSGTRMCMMERLRDILRLHGICLEYIYYVRIMLERNNVVMAQWEHCAIQE